MNDTTEHTRQEDTGSAKPRDLLPGEDACDREVNDRAAAEIDARNDGQLALQILRKLITAEFVDFGKDPDRDHCDITITAYTRVEINLAELDLIARLEDS